MNWKIEKVAHSIILVWQPPEYTICCSAHFIPGNIPLLSLINQKAENITGIILRNVKQHAPEYPLIGNRSTEWAIAKASKGHQIEEETLCWTPCEVVVMGSHISAKCLFISSVSSFSHLCLYMKLQVLFQMGFSYSI